MKKLLSITCLVFTTLLLTNCSSDSSTSISTYFGKWEADTIRFTDGKTVKYTEIGTFNKNEVIEIFTDQHQSVKLIQYYTDKAEPMMQIGSVNDDYIVLEKEKDKRKINTVKPNDLSLITNVLINNKYQVVQINYKRIGNPRDEEPKK